MQWNSTSFWRRRQVTFLDVAHTSIYYIIWKLAQLCSWWWKVLWSCSSSIRNSNSESSTEFQLISKMSCNGTAVITGGFLASRKYVTAFRRCQSARAGASAIYEPIYHKIWQEPFNPFRVVSAHTGNMLRTQNVELGAVLPVHCPTVACPEMVGRTH